MVIEKYTCPRCGYQTNIRFNMSRHLYNKKKICPATKLVIILTDEIKTHLLENRIYIIPIPPIQQINNINNYQQINNLIFNMDNLDKINKFLKHKEISLIDLEDTLNDDFHMKVYKLKHNKYKDFQLNFQNIMEIIDEITTINDINRLNILYDDILNKIKIFCEGEWISLLIEKGINDIIEKIKSYYLDSYECYLLRKIIDGENNMRYVYELQETLYEYYKFLGWFDIVPYVYENNNNKIIYNNDNENFFNQSDNYSISDKYYNKYKEIVLKINKSEQNKVKKGIENIIKKNTKSFIIDLNKKLLKEFNNDEEFKKEFIKDIFQIS